MQRILLLKDKTRNDTPNNTAYVDPYEEALSSINCTSVFVPVLEHVLLNIRRLSDCLKEGSKSKYWGVIVTSQRAVETLRTAWNEVVSGNYTNVPTPSRVPVIGLSLITSFYNPFRVACVKFDTGNCSIRTYRGHDYMVEQYSGFCSW